MRFALTALIISFTSFAQQPCPATQTKPNQQLKKRETAFLDAHNTRRKDWHTKNGKSYVPMKFSKSLKRSAKRWALQLVKDACIGKKGIYHDPQLGALGHGENVALSRGSGSWAILPTADKVIGRFVEREIPLPPHQKGHLTQVLWRPTKYVGCADASHTYADGKEKCHVTVCRYVKPGNCNMGNWSQWKEKMLADDSPCGKPCPKEGCF